MNLQDYVLGMNGKENRWVTAIVEPYTSEKRTYHNMSHIENMWNWHLKFRSDPLFESMRLSQIDTEIATAIAFHDVHYGSTELHRNEALSASSFTSFCSFYGISVPEIPKVIQMIYATKDHWNYEIYAGTYCDDIEYFLDLDLMSMSVEYPEFVKINNDITQECVNFYSADRSLSSIMKSRRNFLEKVANLPHIYHNAIIRERFEEKAFDNVNLYLERNFQDVDLWD